MEFFPAVLNEEQSDALFERIQLHFAEHGFGLWAVEITNEQNVQDNAEAGQEPRSAEFAGFIGLAIPQFEAHFTPCVEIGWRLAATHWGHGYATEGASAVIQYAFKTLKLSEVVSMTAVDNLRSQRVMEKIGMTRSKSDDFDHPKIEPGHRLSRHMLYRKSI